MEIDDPGQAAKGYPQSAKKAQELAKYVHAVIFVVKANDPRLRDNNFKKMMTRFKEHCRDEGKRNISCTLIIISLHTKCMWLKGRKHHPST